MTDDADTPAEVVESAYKDGFCDGFDCCGRTDKDDIVACVAGAKRGWIHYEHTALRTQTDETARLREALEPFALVASEGLVKVETGHVTITTCAEYFHRARAALGDPR